MSKDKKFEKITLKDIANISEDEFKKQLSAWIDERGVSQVLQSKLRADLFEHFNRTTLGRQMQLQHERSHQMVLSPLILVLNTLVAEFLYTENCHFTLSVFATEVPHKNALPNFESTPRDEQFRFTSNELNDIFQAIGLSTTNLKSIEEFYMDKNVKGNKMQRKKSLLYSIFKMTLTKFESTIENGRKESKIGQSDQSKHSTNVTTTCNNCCRLKSKKFQVNSRYFKYLNRYLDVLSERVREMSKSLANIYDRNQFLSKEIQNTKDETTINENSLKEKLNTITEQLEQLNNSKRKTHKLREILLCIERLSCTLEKCGTNLENILLLTNKCIQNESEPTVAPTIVEQDVDYTTWLKNLQQSKHGKHFIERLEASLQCSVAKEEENIERMFAKKLENYRTQMKNHYKLKYTNNGKRDDVSPVIKSKYSTVTNGMNNGTHLLSNALNVRANEKEQYVDRIIETAKVRLQELERESEKIDESFQAYLKRQKLEKNQLSKDLSRIWHEYSLEKTILDQHKPNGNEKVSYSTPLTIELPAERVFTKPRSRITNLLLCSNGSSNTNCSNADNVLGIQNQQNEELMVENPFKELSISYLPRKSVSVKEISNISTVSDDVKKNAQNDKNEIVLSLSESSYENLPPKFNEQNSLEREKNASNLTGNAENLEQIPDGIPQTNISKIYEESSKLLLDVNNEVEENVNINNENDDKKPNDDIQPSQLIKNTKILRNLNEMEKDNLEMLRNNSPIQLLSKTIAVGSSTDEELVHSLDISIGNAKESSSSTNEWI